MTAPEENEPGDDLADLLVRRLEQGELTLPPFPEVGLQVLSLASEDATSAKSLANLIQRDAGLASAVIRYANTAALSGVMRIVSMQQAVSRLGMRRVGELAFAASLRSAIGTGSRYHGLLDAHWRRSLATALYAKEIARELRSSVEVAFLCGLLRGIGPPLVFHALSEIPKAEGQPDDERAAELGETLGPAFLYAAGCAWRLPESVTVAVDPATDPEARSVEASIAALAERLADLALSDEEEDQDEVPPFGPDADADRLNLYSDTLEDLLARGPSIRKELDNL